MEQLDQAGLEAQIRGLPNRRAVPPKRAEASFKPTASSIERSALSSTVARLVALPGVGVLFPLCFRLQKKPAGSQLLTVFSPSGFATWIKPTEGPSNELAWSVCRECRLPLNQRFERAMAGETMEGERSMRASASF